MGGDTGVLALQDDETGAPWSGIVLESVAGDNAVAGLEDLRPGDVINITQATIEEDFDLTKIDEEDIVFSVESTGGTTIDPVVVTTDALLDDAIAEAHEGEQNPWLRARWQRAPPSDPKFLCTLAGNSSRCR